MEVVCSVADRVDLISGGWEDDRVNDIAKQVKQVIRWSGEQVKQVNVDELDVIDYVYLWGIESLYTWKTLVPERLRSILYSNTLPNTLADTLPDTLANTLPDTLADTLADTI